MMNQNNTGISSSEVEAVTCTALQQDHHNNYDNRDDSLLKQITSLLMTNTNAVAISTTEDDDEDDEIDDEGERQPIIASTAVSVSLPSMLQFLFGLNGFALSMLTLPLMYIVNSKVEVPLPYLPSYGAVAFLPYSLKPIYAYLCNYYATHYLSPSPLSSSSSSSLPSLLQLETTQRRHQQHQHQRVQGGHYKYLKLFSGLMTCNGIFTLLFTAIPKGGVVWIFILAFIRSITDAFAEFCLGLTLIEYASRRPRGRRFVQNSDDGYYDIDESESDALDSNRNDSSLLASNPCDEGSYDETVSKLQGHAATARNVGAFLASLITCVVFFGRYLMTMVTTVTTVTTTTTIIKIMKTVSTLFEIESKNNDDQHQQLNGSVVNAFIIVTGFTQLLSATVVYSYQSNGTSSSTASSSERHMNDNMNIFIYEESHETERGIPMTESTMTEEIDEEMTNDGDRCNDHTEADALCHHREANSNRDSDDHSSFFSLANDHPVDEIETGTITTTHSDSMTTCSTSCSTDIPCLAYDYGTMDNNNGVGTYGSSGLSSSSSKTNDQTAVAKASNWIIVLLVQLVLIVIALKEPIIERTSHFIWNLSITTLIIAIVVTATALYCNGSAWIQHRVGLFLILRNAVPSDTMIVSSFFYFLFRNRPLLLQFINLVDSGVISLSSWSYTKLWSSGRFNQGRCSLSIVLATTIVLASLAGLLNVFVFRQYQQQHDYYRYNNKLDDSSTDFSSFKRSNLIVIAIVSKLIITFFNEWAFLPEVILASTSVNVRINNNGDDDGDNAPVVDCRDDSTASGREVRRISIYNNEINERMIAIEYGTMISCIDFGDQLGSLTVAPLVGFLNISRDNGFVHLDRLIMICASANILISIVLLPLLIEKKPK